MRKIFKQLFIAKFGLIAIFVFILSGYLTSAFATSATVAVSGTRGMISISGTAIFPNNSSTGGSIFFYVDNTYLGGTSTSSLSTLSYSVFCDSTTLVDGPHNFSVKAKAADNSEAVASTAAVTYNTPEITINSPSGAVRGVVKCSIFYQYPSSSYGGTLAVYIIKPGVVPYYITGKTLTSSPSAGATGTFDFDFDSTAWLDGNYQIQVKAYVNPAPYYSKINIKYATNNITAYNTPEITINSPSGSIRGVVKCNISYEYPGSSTRAGMLNVYLIKPGTTVPQLLASKDVTLSSSTPTNGTFEFDFDSSALKNGEYQIQAKGYISPPPLTSAFNIKSVINDITAYNTPEITINSPSGVIIGIINCSISYQYPSSQRAGALAVYLIKSGSTYSPLIASKDIILSSSAPASGIFEFELNSKALQNGKYTIQAKGYVNPPPLQSRVNVQDIIKEVEINNIVSTDKTVPQDKTTTVGEPINVVNGNMYTSEADISIPAREIPLELSRTYNSQDNFNGSFGWGWRSNFDITLAEQANHSVIETDETGVYTIYMQNNLKSLYIPSPGNYSTLTKNADGTCTIVRKEGRKLSFDNNGRLIRIEGRNGNAVNILRGSGGAISEVSDSANRKLLFSRDSSGRVIQISDPAGRIFKYEYDINSNLIKAIGPLGNQALYQYDSTHNLTRLTDANNHALYFQYDSSDRAYHSWQDDKNNEVTLSFNPTAKTSSVTDALGNITKYEYNNSGVVVKITDSQNKVQSFTWDYNLNKTSVTNQNGFTTSFTYDNKANLLSLKDPLNNAAAFTYEPNFSRVSSITNALGKTTKYLYDTKGNLIQVKDALDNLTAHSYDSLGGLITTTDANNNITTFSYDACGNLAVLTNALGNSTKFSYDLLGNNIRVTDALGNSTNFSYDLLNRLEQVTYQDSSTISYKYDAVGNLISLTDAADKKTTYGYDVADRLIQVTDALGNITKYTYNKEGNKLSIIDANSNTTQYIYDSLKRLIRATDAINNQTSYTYDSVGNPLSIIDAKGNITNYAYDANNRRTQIIYADGSKEKYSYDANSNLVEKTAPNGKTIYYEYDALNRLIEKGLSPEGSVPGSVIAYNYDAGSRLTQITDKNGAISYEFDALNRTTKVTYSDGKSVAYSYDENSNRIKLTYPDLSYINYEYDALNRLTAIKNQSNNAVANYIYDALSRRAQLNYANSTQTVYTYDSANRLIQLANRQAGQPANFSQYDYTYDYVGNRLNKITTSPSHQAPVTENYTYDKIYQLTQVSSSMFQVSSCNYDALGNRVSTVNAGTTNYTSNNLNQYTQVGSASYIYDANGNLTSDGIKTYVYDYENRLTSASSGSGEAAYTYDALGRRIKKQSPVDSQQSTESYIYDANQIIAEYDEADNLTKKYIYGPGIDQPVCVIARSDSDEAIYYYHFDGLGSVTDLTDSTGAVVETYSYDGFGKPTIKDISGFTLQVSSIGNSFMFTGREYDSETDLYYYRARYYNTSIGRFLQRDPLGYIDGPNPYTYCLNAPINWVDPLGLYSWGEFFGDSSNTIAGFGDFISFGVSDILRRQMGINNVINKCSKGYKAGKFMGIGYSAVTGVASLFNAGANTVLYSGKWALDAAKAGKGTGIILGETLGGRILNTLEQVSWSLTGKQLPDIVWKAASWFFAGNAKGIVQAYVTNPRTNSIFLSVEVRIIELLGNATFVFK